MGTLRSKSRRLTRFWAASSLQNWTQRVAFMKKSLSRVCGKTWNARFCTLTRSNTAKSCHLPKKFKRVSRSCTQQYCLVMKLSIRRWFKMNLFLKCSSPSNAGTEMSSASLLTQTNFRRSSIVTHWQMSLTTAIKVTFNIVLLRKLIILVAVIVVKLTTIKCLDPAIKESAKLVWSATSAKEKGLWKRNFWIKPHASISMKNFALPSSTRTKQSTVNIWKNMKIGWELPGARNNTWIWIAFRTDQTTLLKMKCSLEP